ncbi:Hypothetical_protein [Hexamita inflata]|uniref:Hypothetical_protein n=1 Tax=Hexamita inflata TaxID=28002 RepID=A0AA86V0J4_9EUKA|nr:Hypothetical protein HINF_LOCUS63404 [Hexamita inflata]
MCSPKVRRLWIQKWTAESSSYWTILTSALHVTCSQLFTAVFSTGELARINTSVKIRSLIVDHRTQYQTTFSGHSHLFSAFQKETVFLRGTVQVVAAQNQMTDSSYGVRKWPREELHTEHCPSLPTAAAGTTYLDSWMRKFTQNGSEYTKDKNGIRCRDLDSDGILQSYEQPI